MLGRRPLLLFAEDSSLWKTSFREFEFFGKQKGLDIPEAVKPSGRMEIPCLIFFRGNEKLSLMFNQSWRRP